MTETKPYASSLKTKAIAIFSVDDESKPYANITNLVTHFYHIEDIMSPAYEGRLVIVDTGASIISSMPIQGNEKVTIEVEDTFNTTYTYEYRVWTVANRQSADRKQVYTLGLISPEGLQNESVKVAQGVEGNISSVVGKLVQDNFDAEITKGSFEETLNGCKIIPRRQSPFSVIRSLQTQGIPKKRPQTAGFVFFQTRKGFNFRSFDGLIADNTEIPKNEWFHYSMGKRDEEDANLIQEISYHKEIDMMKKLREGSYSSISCYFNINTGKYEESVYSMEKEWTKMEHLGSQTKLPQGSIDRSNTPTRVLSSVVNNEFWYNGTESAAVKGENKVKDYQIFHLQQAIARAGLMFNQHLNISTTGHLEFCAGDCIEIRIPNQQAEVLKEGGDTWDPEHSGTFLVKRVTHQFHVTGDLVYSVLELIRDSYGIKNKETKVK
tara:strand:+ start:7267 stop:8574 length:1308 start_codon:yes stop_codon:yes gene_type:complete